MSLGKVYGCRGLLFLFVFRVLEWTLGFVTFIVRLRYLVHAGRFFDINSDKYGYTAGLRVHSDVSLVVEQI